MEKLALGVQLFFVCIFVAVGLYIFWMVMLARQQRFKERGKKKESKELEKKRRFIFLVGKNDDGKPWVKEVCELSLSEDENKVLKRYRKEFGNELRVVEAENITEAAVKLLKQLENRLCFKS